jgi:thiol-disulfide isomerase/thioredoxin
MKKILLIASLIFSLFTNHTALATTSTTTLYLFYGEGCPHCAKEELFLTDFAKKNPQLLVKKYEVWHNPKNAELLGQVGSALGLKVSGVPLTVVGNQSVTGFNSVDDTGKEISRLVIENLKTPTQDVVNSLLTGETVDAQVKTDRNTSQQNSTLPWLGQTDLKKLSLPLLTIIIGLLDSLNPCAMWVLLFLIGIILGMDNRPKMWLMGWTFIGASAAAYFIFLAAWLNIYQFIKYVSWINWAIAALAITVGLFNLWDFWVSRNGGCDIAGNPTKRKIIMDKIKHFALNESFFVALIGLGIVGAAVNMVELLCSAGLPAVYIPILTATAKSQLTYYLYLILYCFCYILIQVVVFLIAMFSLKQVAISSRLTRWFGLASGLLMITVGLFLIFKSNILSLFI